MFSIPRTIGVMLLVATPLAAHPGSGIVVDRKGQVFFADTGGGVWKIDAQQRLTKQDETKFHWPTPLLRRLPLQLFWIVALWWVRSPTSSF